MAGDDSCSYGTIRLDDSTVTILLTPDSIVFRANARQGRSDIYCYTCEWYPYQFRSSHSWSSSDVLTIQSGSFMVSIAHTQNSPTDIQANYAHARKTGFSCFVNSTGLTVQLGAETGSTVTKISLVNAAGKTISSNSSPFGHSVTIPLKASGMLFLRLEFIDGTVHTRPVPLIRGE
ncbi:MAG: hypothetical protein GF350_09155 [Chitinivibrionales bacterium]|nr:hypothetical protein [Chitinivibrionales bacterium]